MQRLAATPHMADRFMRANADVNVAGELSKIKTPTLVRHTTGDLRVPYSFAQEIAAGIPGAKLVPLESRNHIVLPDEPAHRVMSDAIADFLGEKRLRGALPGTGPMTHRLDAAVGSLQIVANVCSWQHLKKTNDCKIFVPVLKKQRSRTVKKAPELFY
jgi:hypothetical protein